MTTKPDPGIADRGACVLIVDDEPRNRELLGVMLAREGYVIRTAASGEEAMAAVAAQAPDLILLDVMMPGMDGYQVTAEIKTNSATRKIPVILITALDDREAKMRGLTVGAEDFLSKPVDRAELLARVRNLLRLKEATEQLETALAEAHAARLMAEHANSAKTLFLRAMSHELRTPLNAISGYTEILQLGIRGTVNEAQTQDLGRIKRAAAYLTRLINDVLTVARMEGAKPLDLVSLAVNPILVEVEGLCALQARAKGLTLTVGEAPCEVVVLADAERLQQILLNLIINAIKFTNSGSIDVTCSVDAGMLQLTVKDTGVGVRTADIERVFEAFVQIDRHLTTSSQQGVGLGLSISRELARAMHGDLTLESAEGAGSTFTLRLPLAADPSVEPLGEPATATSEVAHSTA